MNRAAIGFAALVSLISVGDEATSAECGEWRSVAPMNVQRGEHGLVTLRDGRVLAVGGHTSSDPRTHSTSEIYDVEADVWGPTAALLEPRQESERPRLLNDGTVMLVGGHGSKCCDALTQADLYDPETGGWRPTGAMTHRRGEHAVVVLQSGDVLVAGGFDWGTETAARLAEVYSIETREWTVVDEFPEPGLANIAVLLADGKVLVKGDGHSVHCYIFDPRTRKFTEAGNLREKRLRPTLTLLSDGRVFAAGGKIGTGATPTAELYDPVTGQWSMTASMSFARIRHTATLLDDGRVLVAGGHDRVAHASAEIYDSATGSWTETAIMAGKRSSHDATKLHDGRVLVSGGWSAVIAGETLLNPTLATVEVFDPKACAK